MSVRLLRMALPAVLIAAAVPAAAHITLETPAAPAGSYYKAVFRVGHGCDGASTTAIRIRIPAGVTGVKPQPKPGWQLAVAMAAPDAEAHAVHAVHGRAGAAVSEVAWTGGSLSDAHYDEFALRVKLPDAPGTTLHFPVIQTCAEGELQWVEILKPGDPAGHDRRPAPSVRLEARP
jgi:uncharacterized protein YcnI